MIGLVEFVSGGFGQWSGWLRMMLRDKRAYHGLQCMLAMLQLVVSLACVCVAGLSTAQTIAQ